MSAPLRSWAEVREAVVLVFEVRPHGDGLSTIVPPGWQVQITPVGDESAIEIVGVVGSASSVTTTTALKRNLDMIIGGACLDETSLVIRQVLPLAAIARADLEETIRTIALACASLRQRFDG